jgi:L-iditol 2-dehydrogenase
MKAAVLEAVGVMNVKDIPVPKCGEDEVLLKIAACAVCGTDVKVYHHGHKHIRPPRVTGHEISGTVVEVGKGVKDFKIGDRVAVAPAVPCGECRFCRRGIQGMCDNLLAIGYQWDGGFAEYMAVPGRAVKTGCLNKIPDGMSLEEAAIAEPLACCINAQELAWVGLGQTVVVIGAGPIGCFHVQLARANGATKVILVDISAERLAMSQIVRPDASVDGSATDAIKAVLGLTDGDGADVVITACSSGKAQEQALQMVAKRGVVNFFGGLPKDKPFIQFDSNLTHYREFYVVGNHGSSPQHNQMAIALIASGKIAAKPLISHRLSIAETLEGIALTEKAKGLKVIIKND